MKSLSTPYNKESDKWLGTDPGKATTIPKIGTLFKTAYMKAATPEVVLHDFRGIGISP